MIYLDLEDPPDTSPYGTPAPNDNLGGPGSLSPGCQPTSSETTGPDGTATTVLTITDRYAGDNYRVRARLTTGAPLIAKSGIITAWKRAFFELDRMFRAPGQYLIADSPTDPGPTTIEVLDTRRFNEGMPGDLVYIFDSVNDDPAAAHVVAKTATTLTLDQHLDISYTTANGAYVGGDADMRFDVDVGQLLKAYDDGLTDFIYRAIGSHLLPYAPVEDLRTVEGLRDFSAKSFQNGTVATDATNYVHLLVVARSRNPSDPATPVGGVSSPSTNYSYVNVLDLEEACDICMPESLANLKRHTAAHEFGHQFGFPNAVAGTPSWCGMSGGVCEGDVTIMAADTNVFGPIMEFSTSELVGPAPSVRRSADPF